MRDKLWPTVSDSGPTNIQHWDVILYLVTIAYQNQSTPPPPLCMPYVVAYSTIMGQSSKYEMSTQCWLNAGSARMKPALIERLVSVVKGQGSDPISQI